jgi:hypothetical protein
MLAGAVMPEPFARLAIGDKINGTEYYRASSGSPPSGRAGSRDWRGCHRLLEHLLGLLVPSAATVASGESPRIEESWRPFSINTETCTRGAKL